MPLKSRHRLAYSQTWQRKLIETAWDSDQYHNVCPGPHQEPIMASLAPAQLPTRIRATVAEEIYSVLTEFSSVQLLSCVRLFAAP